MKYLIAIGLIFFASIVNASPTDNIKDKAKYDKLIDYTGFAFSYIAIVKQNPRLGAEFKTQCGCTIPDINNCAPPDSTVVANYLTSNGLNSTLLLFDQVELLKTRFEEFKLDPSNYLDKVFHNTTTASFSRINEFYADHNGDAAYDPIIITIGNKIDQDFKADTAGAKPMPNAGAKIASQDSLANAPHNAATAPKHSIFSFDINITSLLLLIAGLALLYRVINQRISLMPGQQADKEVPDHVKGYVKAKLKDHSKAASKNEDGIAALNEKIDKLNNELNEAKLEIKQLKGDGPVASQALIAPLEHSGEVFYLPAPGRDGNFDNSVRSSIYREGASIYRATTISPSMATFQIDQQSASITLALADLRKRVEPCCQPLNAYNRYIKRIVTMEPGLLELHGDKWQVTTKSGIVYEN